LFAELLPCRLFDPAINALSVPQFAQLPDR